MLTLRKYKLGSDIEVDNPRRPSMTRSAALSLKLQDTERISRTSNARGRDINRKH